MTAKNERCGDCKFFKTSDCPSFDNFREYVDGRPLMDADCAACGSFQPNPKAKKQKKVLKDSGLSNNGCFEAIYCNDKPMFLVKNGDAFSIVESVEVNGEAFHPKDVRHIPYEPYGWFEGEVLNREDLFWKIWNEINSFVDVEPIWKDVLSACVLFSYQQEKLQTTPYIFLYGDNESGKSTVQGILSFLCYRPMYGVTIPAADLFGYLEDLDGIGCILEDEVQGIDNDTDKIKIYKAGYKQGAIVPRMIMTEHDRIIKYYHTFCFKVCASEQIPQVKGFNERFLFIPMVEGTPEKEFADITKEDLKRLHDLRNMLLKWRMLSRTWELPVFELPMKGRLKELWKPILQITHGLTVYEGVFKFVEDQKKERLSIKQDTLEGHIVKVIVEIFNTAKDTVDKVPFPTIWDSLVLDLNGKVDDNKPNVMDTSEFFDVTKNKVGYRLREVLSGKSKVLREKLGDSWISTKAYVFDLEKLKRIAKKYGFELVTKLPCLPSFVGVQEPKTTESMEKNNGDNVEKGIGTPQELSNLSNLVTNGKAVSLEDLVSKTKELVRLTTDFGIETCVSCGFKGRLDWQITLFDSSWGLLCGSCGEKVAERLNKNE